MSLDSTVRAKDPSPKRTRPRLVARTARDNIERALDAPLVVGSSASAQWVLSDPLVSRLHIEFDPRPDGVWVRDLGSTNGTYVDGLRVLQARLPDGARVSIGSSIVEVYYDATSEPEELWPEESFGPVLGKSLAMRRLFLTMSQAARSDASALIQAETGCGKELVARAIHDASARQAEPYVVVDCGALPPDLLESELFGHAKGAFTGATNAHIGAFENANGGTILLDEIGELPMALQPKLLRVLEARTVRRLGETAHRPVNVRILAATHRDLRSMVNVGTFREDLYFRLAVLPISIAPLRERPEDIEALLSRFLNEHPAHALGAEGVTRLLRHHWGGNVRELRNFAERVAAFGAERAFQLLSGEGILADHAEERWPIGGEAADPGPNALTAIPKGESLHDFRERWAMRAEEAYLRELLKTHGSNLTQAAKIAGIARGHIYRLIERHKL